MVLAISFAAAGALGIMGFLYGIFRDIHAVNSKLDSFTDSLQDFFEASEGQLSPFAQSINNIADHLAQAQALSTQAAIRGSLGGSQKAINAALEQAAIEENPELAVTEFLPKSLKKNQLAMGFVQQLLSKAAAGRSGAGPSSGPPQNGQVRFKF